MLFMLFDIASRIVWKYPVIKACHAKIRVVLEKGLSVRNLWGLPSRLRGMTDHNEGRQPLKRSTLFFYGLTEFPIHITLMPMTAFIPNFYASDLGISLAVVGTIVLVTRLFDVITDPLIGFLSDRTNTRWGRRRPWLVASLPLMMIGVYKLFLPDHGVGGAYLSMWMTVVWLGWTMLLIPYWAWAAELSPDYQERSIITGWRSAIGIAGSLAAQLLPIGALFIFGYGGTGEVLILIGIMMLIMLPLAIGLTVWKVPERRDYIATTIPFGRALRMMWRNGPFKRLVISFFLTWAGLAVTTSLYLFYVRHVVDEQKAGVAMLSAYYLCNLLGVGFWVWVSQHIGKHRAWAASLLLIAVAHPFYLLHGQGDFVWMLPVSIVSGIAGGAFVALPNSMKADVIDLDGLKSGADRAGSFFAALVACYENGRRTGCLVGVERTGMDRLRSISGCR